jgi:hypothetical protein
MFYINVIESTVSFTLNFIILTLSLSFWGRQTTRVLRFKEAAQYGDMKLIVAGAGAMFFLSQAAILFLPNYLVFFNVFFIVGVAGSLIEILLFFKSNGVKTASKLILVTKNIKAKESFFVSIILAVILSFFYSAVWPSGKLDLWMNGSGDFYYWITAADYYLGGLDGRTFDYSPYFTFISKDALGTSLLLAFIATAKNMSPLFAAPSCVLTLMIWQAAAVAGILRKIFGFGRVLTAVLAAGWILGSFANYIAISGMFAQLTATFLFLVALGEHAPRGGSLSSDGIAKRMFFPLFCLLVAYQGGYVVFAGVLMCVGVLSGFLNVEKPSLGARLTGALKSGPFPVLLATVLTMVVMPGFGYDFLVRLKYVYQQTVGWPLPFLSPLLFLGVPYFVPNSFLLSSDLVMDKLNIILYVILILFIVVLLVIINSKKVQLLLVNNNSKINKNNACRSISIITTISIAFIVSLILYLALYMRYGNLYKVWKFVSYTALPLSFIPLSLLIFVVICLSRNFNFKYLNKCISLFCLIVYLILFIRMPVLKLIPFTYYGIVSAMPFIYELSRIETKIPKNMTLLVDVDGFTKMPLVPLIIKNNQIKGEFLYALDTFKSNSFYNYTVDKDTIIISDVEYHNIYRGENNRPSLYKLYVYAFDQLEKMGMASINSGMIPYDWKTSPVGAATSVTIKIPLELRGLPLKFSMALSPDSDADGQNCRTIGLDLMDGEQVVAGGIFEVGDISLDIPDSLINSDFIRIMLYQTEGGDGALRPCVQGVRGVGLEKLDSGA